MKLSVFSKISYQKFKVMAKESFYFSHDYNARSDPKLVKLSMKLGMNGLGIYWCIIEMLYEQEGFITLNNIENIAFELHTECGRITDVLKNFDLFKFEEDRFYSESVLRRLALRDEKVNNARESALKRWHPERYTNALQPHISRNAIKERKGKERKDDKIVEFESFWNLYDINEDQILCETLWMHLDNSERIECINKLPAYIEANPDKQYRKSPKQFLKNKSWRNEIIKRNGSNVSESIVPEFSSGPGK